MNQQISDALLCRMKRRAEDAVAHSINNRGIGILHLCRDLTEARARIAELEEIVTAGVVYGGKRMNLFEMVRPVFEKYFETEFDLSTAQLLARGGKAVKVSGDVLYDLQSLDGFLAALKQRVPPDTRLHDLDGMILRWWMGTRGVCDDYMFVLKSAHWERGAPGYVLPWLEEEASMAHGQQ